MSSKLYRPTFTYGGISTPDITGAANLIIGGLSVPGKMSDKLIAQERQAEIDNQNKQLFDIKMAEIDRANKDRETSIKFGKGMLQPQPIGGLITDNISPEQVAQMEFTQEELEEYDKHKGDLTKVSPSTKAKAEMQMKMSDFADTLPGLQEYQETGYEQAKRIANNIELTPAVLEELKKYQVADIAAQKEAKKEGATYAAEAKELETKIAQLKTKQGSIYDKAAGVGKEWGKSVSDSNAGKLNSDKMLKYAEMVKNTDSAEELQGMIQEVFTNPNIPNNQKESIAANIVLSSGAKLPQGFLDFRNLNVSVEDAQKATTQYLENLQNGTYGTYGGNGAYGTSNRYTSGSPAEVKGIENEIALLEARRAGALAKANAYSVDRSTAAKNSIKARMDDLFGKKTTTSSGGASETSKGDKPASEKPGGTNTKGTDVKTIVEDIQSKEKDKKGMSIDKLTELYKSLGGTGGSAGLHDDVKIKTQAEILSKELGIPYEKIIEDIRSNVRQENLVKDRDAIIAKRMSKHEMDKLRNDPDIKKAYYAEARRRGYVGTSAKPFSLDKFIKDNYSDRLKYN